MKRSFNRDIVECKVCIPFDIYKAVKRFNRDIVECKDYSISDRVISGAKVLIET